MLRYEKVDKIPIAEKGFKPGPETLELAEQIRGLEPGEVLRIITPDDLDEPDKKRYGQKIANQAKTAVRHVKEGYFRVYYRRNNIFVQRTE